MKYMSPRARISLAAILLLALAIRVAYTFESQSNPMHLVPQMDAAYHLEWARTLLAGGDHHPGPFFRAPLYPWFLAACLWLSQGSLLVVTLLQALLGVCTTWLTYKLALTCFPRSGTRGPLIAALLVATNWVLVYFDAELLLPSLAIPLQLLALRLSVSNRDSERPLPMLIAGLIWGISALVRPNCLLFVIALCAWKTLMRPRSPLMAATLALGAVLPILPITAYNASQGDTVLISSQAGINLWIGNNPHSDGSTAIVPGTRPDWWGGHHDAVQQAEQSEGRHLKPSEVSRHYSTRSLHWIREAPIAWLTLLGQKAQLLFGHEELGNNANIHFVAHHFSWTMSALPPSFALLFSLGLAGLWLGYKRRELHGELPSFLLIYSLSILAFFVCARFRAPLLPILACGAGHSLSWLTSALKAGRITSALKLTALIGLLVIVSTRKGRATHSDSAQGFWQLGVAAQQAGDLDAAIGHYEASLQSEARYWYAWRDLGKTHLQNGDLISAERALRRGLSIRPQEPWVSDLLADVLFQAQRAAELKGLGEALLNANPAHALSHYHIARGCLLLGENQAAQEQVILGLRLDPECFQLHQLAARFSLAAGDKDEACRHISAALSAAEAAHDKALIQIASDEATAMGCEQGE